MTRNAKIWAIWGISVVFYIAMNVVALTIRGGIPGMATMIGWGFVMPLILIVVWWTVAIANRGELAKWWLAGVLATAIFATAGIVTAKKIAAMWATI